MTTKYSAGIRADYWSDEIFAETLTHRSLPEAVKAHIEYECGVTPRDIFMVPPGYMKIEPSHSSEESQVVPEIAHPLRQERKAQFLECLRALEPCSFYAWLRGEVHQAMIDAIAANLAEITVVHELEELIDPNGLRPEDKALMRRLEDAFTAVLKEQLVGSAWIPWHHDRVGEVRLTAVQMEEIARDAYPHWFE